MNSLDEDSTADRMEACLEDPAICFSCFTKKTLAACKPPWWRSFVLSGVDIKRRFEELMARFAKSKVEVIVVEAAECLEMTAAEFERRTGAPPMNDDLDRVNCTRVGAVGHYLCGWCFTHDRPRASCGCIGKG